MKIRPEVVSSQLTLDSFLLQHKSQVMFLLQGNFTAEGIRGKVYEIRHDKFNSFSVLIQLEDV